MFLASHPNLPFNKLDQIHSLAVDPNVSVWVSASAGSGKTTVLVKRVLNLLLHDVHPERIVCLTFSKAAAAEIRDRINKQLLQWTAVTEEQLVKDLSKVSRIEICATVVTNARRLFNKTLDMPGGLRVSTIHSFCQSLLKRFPLETGVAPYFQVIDKCTSLTIMSAAYRQTLLSADQLPVLATAMRTVATLMHETELVSLLNELTNSYHKLRILLHHWDGIRGLVAAIYYYLGLADCDTTASILITACRETEFAKLDLLTAAEVLLNSSGSDVTRGTILTKWLTAEHELRVATFDDYLKIFLTDAGSIRKTLVTKKVATLAPKVSRILTLEAQRLVQIQHKRTSATIAEATTAILHLYLEVLNTYYSYKKEHALLDYDDLIFRAESLLKLQDTKTLDERIKSSLGIDHLLIDEAQDNSIAQWNVINSVIQKTVFAEPSSRNSKNKTVFIAGDYKQSVYSFQGAEPNCFNTIHSSLMERARRINQPWIDIPLHISFRSVPVILKAVDTVFAKEPACDGLVLTGEENVRHVAYRSEQDGLVEIWPPIDLLKPCELSTIADQSSKDVQINTKPSVLLAKLVAYRIMTMITSCESLQSRGRSIQASDIAILVRQRSHFTRDLSLFLREFNIPVTSVDHEILNEQIVIMDLVALGNILLLPEDDLTLATILKSPIIGLVEEQLLFLAHARGSSSLWKVLQQSQTGKDDVFNHAYTFLKQLVDMAYHYHRPYELYTAILETLGVRRRLLAHFGVEAEVIIDEFLAIVLEYEENYVPSLQGFLHWFYLNPVELECHPYQAEAVRILTVHGAKGLEFPVVFLPDTLQKPCHSSLFLWPTNQNRNGVPLWWSPRGHPLEDSLFISMEKETTKAIFCEYHRLLYVAMTRAEDRLYICGWKTASQHIEEGCWYNLIRTALESIVKEEADSILASSGLVPKDTKVLRLTNTCQAKIGREIIK